MKAALTRVWDTLEADPRRVLLIAIGLSAVQRLPFLSAPLQPDEGGFLMVAKQWTTDGSALYGDQWVDRPPLLLLVFRFAAILGGSAVTLRVFALVFGVITVVAAWWSGRLINGARGAVAAALVAAAIGSSFSLDGFALTGECMAGALVMSSCALTLHAAYRNLPTRQALALAFLAGLLAAMAFLIKQNIIDAAIFAVVLLGPSLRRTWPKLTAGAVGLGLPLLVTAAWARSDQGPGLNKLWHAVFRFRQRAFEIIRTSTETVPLQRLAWLLALFVMTGLLLLSWQLFTAGRGSGQLPGLRLALLTMFAYGVVSVLVGGSWWSHYLLQLTPVVVMGSALATRGSLPRLRTQMATLGAVVASGLAWIGGINEVATAQLTGTNDEIVATYLKEASRPGDSIVLAYGAASIIEMSDLSTPYRYSWSLPVRGRDPHLTTLVETLSGADAPTWLVEIGEFDWWGLDTPDFQRVRAARYHVVATVCGHDLYLLKPLVRTLPPTPACH